MNILKNIFGRIWAFWGLVTFVVTFFMFFIPSVITRLFPEPGSQKVFIDIARIWMRVWLALSGCLVKVKGKEHFKKGKAYIVTCNHNSLLDPPLSSPFIPGPNKTIAKTSFANVPIFGLYYAKGAVLVDRKSDRSRRESFEKMKAVLRNGMHMCIYPEGTRNRTNEPLKKFYDGAFKLAEGSGHNIIPAVIFNTKKALPANKPFFFLPHKLEIHFLEEVPVAGFSSDELKEKVFTIMSDYYTLNQ